MYKGRECTSLDKITSTELSKYRLQKAEKMLSSAKRDMEAKDYASANNRAYYSIFHAMRAVLALDGEDYRKHSAVISRFSQLYLKTEIMPREFGKLVSNASLIRNRSDYEDFYVCSVEDTRKLVDGAERFLGTVKVFLEKQPASEEAENNNP